MRSCVPVGCLFAGLMGFFDYLTCMWVALSGPVCFMNDECYKIATDVCLLGTGQAYMDHSLRAARLLGFLIGAEKGKLSLFYGKHAQK